MYVLTEASAWSANAEEFNLFQGRDKECIIVSFVRSTANSRASGASLLGDWHRINVLLTRAKVTCTECDFLYHIFPEAVFFTINYRRPSALSTSTLLFW